jgi:hypothetical protein
MMATWNLYQFYPPNGQALANNAPYLYYKAVAGSYTIPSSPPFGTTPYGDSSATSGSPAFMCPDSYQLLCPGLDGKYGQYTAAKLPLYPAGTNYDMTNGLDDMTSFTSGATIGESTQ